MRHETSIVLLFGLSAILAAGKQNTPPTYQRPEFARPAGDEISFAAPDVTAPELLHQDNSLEKICHCKKIEGNVLLFAVVGRAGKARCALRLLPRCATQRAFIRGVR